MRKPEIVAIAPQSTEHHADWRRLRKSYEASYRVTIDATTTDLSWPRLRNPREPMFGLVALIDDKVVGIVHALCHWSTWTQGDYCYLPDLFTDQAQRNKGIGCTLIEAVYREARQRGTSRVYWLTRDSNATVIALYEKVASRTGFMQYRHVLWKKARPDHHATSRPGNLSRSAVARIGRTCNSPLQFGH